MSEQNQSQRKDAGKPLYHLLPPEVVRLITRDTALAREVAELTSFWERKGELSVPLVNDDVVAVLAFGGQKYAPHLWEQNPMTFTRVYRSAVSHALKEFANPGSVDEESGLPHVAHYRANHLFLATYVLRGYHDLDDRPDLTRGSL